MFRSLITFLFSLTVYCIFILMPVYFYIKKKKSNDVFEYLKLKKNWRKGIFIGSFISILYITLFIIKGRINNNLNINLNIGILWLYGISVGILEEIPIRGFLLRVLQEKYYFVKANIISTLVFLMLHFPNWIIGGADIIQGIASIFVVSLLFGYLVKEYDSLWVTIICHSVFNLSIWIGLT